MQARGVLALELSPGSTIAHAALQQADAGRLAGLVGRDLGTLVPAASELDLVFAAAHFDPAEALRPGWPLHRRLEELRQRAPKAGHDPRVIAFGADRDGQIPQPLRAEDELRGGSLRVLPFLFAGDPAVASAAAERMEALLMDRGMAQADTALCAQEAFGTRIEHARYLTVHDLAAMTALQYRNLGLEALWRVVETALLVPDREVVLDAVPEPLLRYAGGEACIALFSPDAWRRRYMPEGAEDAARLERRFELFQARQRQFAAVLQAHGIDVTFAHCDDAGEL
jgi:hypothetical protein